MSTFNYLGLGSIIVDRLKTTIDGINGVDLAIDLQNVQNTSLTTPSLWVYFVREDLGDIAGNGIALQIKQVWGIVIVTKNLSEQDEKLKETGELITKVINSLQGWEPGHPYTVFYRETSALPEQADGGYIYYPLFFSTYFLTRGMQ